jgi:alkyl hydroperoxide reductase subunit D
VIAAVIAEFGPAGRHDTDAAKAAAAIMGMNNVYYRFLHLAGSEDYSKLPAKLRMNVIANPGAAGTSSCGAGGIGAERLRRCITAHEKVLREAGMTPEQVQAAVRIASVVRRWPSRSKRKTLQTQPLVQAA